MNKVIAIGGNLSLQSGFELLKEIVNASNDENVSTVVLFISSSGGDIDIIEPIWDAVKVCEKKVVSIGIGEVASVAAALFMMADERFLFPNTKFLIHQSSYHFHKDNYLYAAALKKIIKSMEQATKLLLSPVRENSIIPEKVLKAKIAKGDWIFTDEETEKYRIVTEKYDMKKVFDYLNVN